MNHLLTKIVTPLILALALFGCEKVSGELDPAAVARANASIEKTLADAKPIGGKSATDAIKDKMKIESNESMRNQNSDYKKSLTAAANFFGFYFINTRNRSDYCQALGVRIQSYVDAFKANNQVEFNEASKIIATSTTPDPEVIYTAIKPGMDKTINFMMSDQAKQAGVSTAELCQAIETNALDYANQMRYASALPEMATQLAKGAQ